MRSGRSLRPVLRVNPKRFLLVEREALEGLAGHRLHRPEALLELGVRLTQGGLGIDAELAGPVDHREQQIAHLLEAMLIRNRVGHFVDLFDDLLSGALRIGPVEAGPSCALLEFFGTEQGGEGRSYSG